MAFTPIQGLIQKSWKAKDPNASEVQPLEVPDWFGEDAAFRRLQNLRAGGGGWNENDWDPNASQRRRSEFQIRYNDAIRENQRRADLKANWARQASGVSDEQSYYQNMADQRNEIELVSGKPAQVLYDPSMEREQTRNDRRRQLASLDALRAAGNLPSRT